MKNIHEILKGIGIEIPEDKKEAFDKAVVENYKTIKEVELLREKVKTAEKDRDTYKEKYDTDIAQRDSDLATLKTQLSEAGQSKEKLATLQAELDNTQSKYAEDKANWEKQLADQQYDFLVDDSVRDIEFSSKAARKVFVDELKANPLQVKDGALLGFTDFVNGYKESYPDSFVSKQEGEGNNPHFSSKTGAEEPDVKGGKGEEEKTFSNPVIW